MRMTAAGSGTGRAAVIGCGVIGAGWAARFLLNGWDVSVFDPDPGAERKLRAVLENARLALPSLTDRMLPPEGHWEFSPCLEDAVAGAGWIQESAPERLDIKRALLGELGGRIRADAVIGSSTSGFRPSELAEACPAARQMMVCHPFNPVYLLPLVEVVAHPGTDPDLLQSACRTLTDLGMRPLVVRREIDAHIADRFLEAVWREALWLIQDDVATTAEIDDAIRLGFGLRWAQMGLFETFRIAGGDAGMDHFLAQFGPCLALPWTRLMDVPELTPGLRKAITQQVEKQSAGSSVIDLERLRDRNLVAILRALKAQDAAAGTILNAHDAFLGQLEASDADCDRPLLTVARRVPLDWTDYNGHMNEARYLQVLGDATDRFMEVIGCDAAYIAAGMSYFTAETHIRHLNELMAGQGIRVETTCLQGESRKMRLFHRMVRNDGVLVATGEHFLLHVDLSTRRTCPARPEVADRLRRIFDAHSELGWPEGAGRAIGQKQ